MKLRKGGSEKRVSRDDPIEADEKSSMPRAIKDCRDIPERHYAKVELQSILIETIDKPEPAASIDSTDNPA